MIDLENSYYTASREINNHKSDKLNLSNISFFTPTMLLPLLNYSRENSLAILVQSNTLDYVKRVLGLLPCTDTTLPFKELPKERDTVNGDARNIIDLLDNKFGGKQTLYHLLDEMISNIYEHSEFTNAFTLSQLYPNIGITEISFMDNGISIPGSFEKAGFDFIDDRDALKQCINGQSTVTDQEDRGYGINSSIRLVTEGTGGEVLIVSGRGLYYSGSRKKYYLLDINNKIDGTLVGIRVHKNVVQNYRSYVEIKRTIT